MLIFYSCIDHLVQCLFLLVALNNIKTHVLRRKCLVWSVWSACVSQKHTSDYWQKCKSDVRRVHCFSDSADFNNARKSAHAWTNEAPRMSIMSTDDENTVDVGCAHGWRLVLMSNINIFIWGRNSSALFQRKRSHHIKTHSLTFGNTSRVRIHL